MIRFDNHLGKISVTENYFANLIARVASESFGVAGLVNADPMQGLQALMRQKDLPDKGVKIELYNNEFIVDLYIVVTYGVNISAIVKSIAHKVAYNLKLVSGLNVAKVNVYVADMEIN